MGNRNATWGACEFYKFLLLFGAPVVGVMGSPFQANYMGLRHLDDTRRKSMKPRSLEGLLDETNNYQRVQHAVVPEHLLTDHIEFDLVDSEIIFGLMHHTRFTQLSVLLFL